MIRGGILLLKHTVRSVADWFAEQYRILRGHRRLRVDGLAGEFDVSSPADYHEISYFARNEMEVLADVVDEIEPGATFFDVGANLGIYAIMASLAGADAVAIEPYPPNIERLRTNARENDTPVRIVEAAVGANSGTVPFRMEESKEVGSVGLAPSSRSNDPETITVPMETVDGIAERIGSPDIMKIDVEGAEGLVLEGATRAVAECRTIYVEVHYETAYESSTRDFGYSPEEITGTLEEQGFRISLLTDKDTQKIIKATRPR